MQEPIAEARRLNLRVLSHSTSGDCLQVKARYEETGQTLDMSGPLNPAHARMCVERVTALTMGLAKHSPGLCRRSELDNLLFVAAHARDISRMRLWPFTHQVEDMEQGITAPYMFITSEMRTGKTKIVVDAAQFAFEQGLIERMIVVAPAPVRDVWFDDVLGELAKHLFVGLPAYVTEFHSKNRHWRWDAGKAVFERTLSEPKGRRLEIIVTNFEFLRSKQRVLQLMPFCTPRTEIVGDESSYIRTHDAAQTIAFKQLRYACGRVKLINGTPIFHSPLDLFSQGNILHPSILQCKYITEYKGRYAIQEPIMGGGGRALTNPRTGRALEKISGWTNLDDLQRRFAPCTVRRLQKDCLDLPPKLDPVTLTATLTPETWRAYKAMRDELVVWLEDGNVATSASAAIRVMRLAQITSGFIGGVEESGINDIGEVDYDLIDSINLGGDDGRRRDDGASSHGDRVGVEDDPDPAGDDPQRAEEFIGREKLDVLLWFIGQRLEADPNLKLVVWCRFRLEVFRMVAEVAAKFPQFETATIMGAQKRADRLRALSLLKPETAPKGPVFVPGIEGTGSFGLDFTAAHTCVTSSAGYSSGKSAQTLDRVYGPAQTEPIGYFDIVAVGPKGQKTIDHIVTAARRAGEDIANWTSSYWVKRLKEE